MTYVKNASIFMDQNGNSIPFNHALELIENNEMHCIDWYLDPYCTFCVRLESQEKDELLEILKKSNAIIHYHFVTFLNERSSNCYSEKAASYMLGVGSICPTIFFEFMNGIMNQNFHPTQRIERTDHDFEELFFELGGTKDQWNQVLEEADSFSSQANRLTETFFEDESLARKSPLGGETFVPFVFVDDKSAAFNVHEIDTFSQFISDQIK